MKDEWDHSEEKFERFRFSCQKGQIRIWYNYFGTGPDLAESPRIRPNPDLQNCRSPVRGSRA